MEGVERWRSTTSAVLLILLAIGVFPGIANGLLKDGLYVSNKTDILFIFNPEFSMTAPTVSVYKQTGRLTGLAYDKCNEQLYWSNVDVVNRGIYRGSLDADGNVDNVTKIIGTDVLEVSGLTFDWVSKHLYWTDSRKKTVEVSDADGGNRRVLVMTGKGAPRGIYADPINGYLFWTDQGQKHIARSRLDGSEQTVIVTQGVDLPNQIVVYKDKLYWVDSSKKTFESSDLNGGQRMTRVITLANGQHIFGLAIHNDRAHITNWMNGQLIGIDTNGTNMAKGIQNLGKDEIFSAIYVSSIYQPKRNDSCASKRCAGLCLPVRANEARCTCPSYGGKILGNDGMSCIAPTNPILLVAMADSGYVGFFDASDHTKRDFYVVGRSLRPVAVAYDPVTKNVFWSDVRERTIHLANIDGTNHRILLRNSHGIGLVEGMLVDVARRQFYYTNIGSVLINGTAYSWHRIETFSLRSLTDVKVKTIVMTADKPRGLALDSTRNHLYYTDWGNRASIVRVNLDGSDPTLIRTGLENPNGIVFLNNRIYFVDSHFKSRQGADGGGSQPPKNGSLYSMNPNGSNLRDILATTGVKLRTPFGLTATTSGLYVGDWETENLILVNLDGTLPRTILQGTSGLMSLSYTQFTATAGSTSCDRKTCGDICMPKSSTESSCNCNSYGGKSLINGGTSCSVPNNFLIVADMNSIKIVSQDGKDSNPYVAVQGVPFTSNYVALTVDSGSRIVYYSDISRKEISALHLSNMTSMSLYRINEVIDGMVYHQNLLYWTDYTNGRISRLNLSPTSGQGLRHEVLVRNLSRPRAIRIHDNYIYWTEWGRVPKISRSTLNGSSSPEQMYTSLKLVWPNGISIFNNKLYLVDGSTKKIYRCQLNPSDRCETVTGTEKVLKHAYDLWATDGGVFYYSDWETGSIKAFDTNKPTKTWTIVEGLMRPTQFQFSPLSSRPTCPSGTCSGGSCVPLWVNPGCDCGSRIPTYDLKNCTSESATSCSYGGNSSAPEQTFKPSPCLNCRCVGRRSWANDPVYNDSVCERIACQKLDCGGGESHIPQGQCCPICRSCGIRITNCPNGSVSLTLSSNQGYVVYDFLPTIKDCLGLAREVSTTRQPTGAIYKRGTTEVLVISRADGATPADCKFNVIVKDITAPIIKCPNNITAYLTEDETSVVVKWRPPEVTENDELDGEAVASTSWGTHFGEGPHNVTYTARDRSGHSDSCWFLVTVEKLKKTAQGTCKIPQIDNAMLTCSVDTALRCWVATCQQGFDKNGEFWSAICTNGVWSLNVTDDILHKTCIKTILASVIGSLEVTVRENENPCPKGVNLKYARDLLKDAIYRGHVRPSAKELTLDVTVKGCDSTSKEMVIDVSVVGKSGVDERQNLTTEINEILKNIRLDLEREFIRVPINDESGLRTVHDLSITTRAATIGCLPGQIQKQDDDCEVCDFGTYHEKSNQTCVRCPPNTYNNLTGQTACIKCPEGTKSGTGAYFVDQCIDVAVKSEFPIMIVVAVGCFLLLLFIIIIAIVCVKRRSDSKGFNNHPNLNVNKVFDPDLDFDCTYDKIADPEPAPNNKNNYESLESAAATAATANTYDTILACTEEGDGKGAEGCEKGSTSEKGDGSSTPPYLEPGKSTPPYLEPGKSTPPYLEPVNV